MRLTVDFRSLDVGITVRNVDALMPGRPDHDQVEDEGDAFSFFGYCNGICLH